MFACILYSVHVQTDCNIVCVCIGMLLCACADCMVLCVHEHVLTAWFCVLVHPCVPSDYVVHVHVMHACTGWLSNIIVLCACVLLFKILLFSYVTGTSTFKVKSQKLIDVYTFI